MNCIIKKYLNIYIVIFSILFSGISGFSQGFEITDTTYFVPGDDDFNLIMSSDKGDIANAKLLLGRGANVNAATIDKITPLMYAVQNGNFEMVKLLVDSAADLNRIPYNGATALIVAAKQNLYDIAEFLVQKGASLDIRDEYGVTALHYAAAYNNYDIMDMLIYYGADKETKDSRGNTPIISATFNNSYEAVDLLIQNEANINSIDDGGRTALMVAIHKNNIEIANLLLDKGADITILNKAGMSTLAYAVMAANMPLTVELVNKGADVNQVRYAGESILDLAKKTEDKEIITYLKSVDAKATFHPNWDVSTVGMIFNFNSTDVMNGIFLGPMDSKYQIGINMGFMFRPVANRVLADISNVTYQFWERRYYFYLGLEKRFKIIENNKVQSGPYIGLNEIITFGGYRGSTLNPKVRLVTAPCIGWYINKPSWGIRVGYEYIDFKTPEISPGRISFTLSKIIQSGIYSKQINWLK